MRSLPLRIFAKLLVLVFLVGATMASGSVEPKTVACWRCVTLDPGGAIHRGCMSVPKGDTGCTPINGESCVMDNTWCHEVNAGEEEEEF